MINKNILPKKYIPLDELVVSSNRLIGGGNLIGFDNFAPLVIGKGIVPLIWLYAKINNTDWIPLIAESKSLHTKFIITENTQERELLIKVDDVIVIKAKMLDDGICNVDRIDLRPIGITLFGDNMNLKIGGSNFSGNTFHGMNFMIAIDEKKKNAD